MANPFDEAARFYARRTRAAEAFSAAASRAGAFARRAADRVFRDNLHDRIATGALEAFGRVPGVRETLAGADKALEGFQAGVRPRAQARPRLDAMLQHMADSRHSYDDMHDLGSGLGGLQADVAAAFGYKELRTAAAEPGARALLAGPVALGAFLGLNVFPLAMEARHLYHRITGDQEAQRRAEEHHNLESPTGSIIKHTLGLPYKKHSVVDEPRSAESEHLLAGGVRKTLDDLQTAMHYDPFKGVAEYFNRLSESYPHLVGQPRAAVRSFYRIETGALEYFARHDSLVLSTLARSMLYGEKVQHTLDYTFKFSPTRFISRMIRAAAGVEKHNYEALAFSGIEGAKELAESYQKKVLAGDAASASEAYGRLLQHNARVALGATDEAVARGLARDLLLRRTVKAAGLVIGGVETVLHYQHLHKELSELRDRFFGTGDTEAGRQRRLDRERRRQSRRARARGERYDPTRPGRDQKVELSTWAKDLVEEFQAQFSPRAQLRTFRQVVTHPKDNMPTLAMYATVAGSTLYGAARAWSTVGGDVPLKRAWDALGKLGENQAGRMQLGAAASGVVGMLTGRTWSSRFGFLSNFIATFGVDKLGQYAGRKIINTPGGLTAASKVYAQLSEVPAFFEARNVHVMDWAKKMADNSAILTNAALKHGALSKEEIDALRPIEQAAERVGMEAVGILAEGSVLIPLRHILRRTGRALDRHTRISRAERRAKKDDRGGGRRKDLWLRRYLLAASAPAYGQQDALLNPDYSPAARAALLLARRDPGASSALDAASRFVSPLRRLRAGFMALAETRGGRRDPEDWKSRLARSYAAPAFSDNDIASNPQYSPAQRVALALLKHTHAGHDALESASGAETRRRQAVAVVGAALHKDGGSVGEHMAHVAHHAVRRHVHRGAQAAKEQTEALPGGEIALGLAQGLRQGAQTAARAAHAAPKHKTKLTVRSRSRHADAAPDERLLHAAYSRYLNYGSKGNAISYTDSNA